MENITTGHWIYAIITSIIYILFETIPGLSTPTGTRTQNKNLEGFYDKPYHYRGRWRLKESNPSSREKHNRAHYRMLIPLIIN